ncbi:MAG: hypothetical protein K8F56_01215 [Rhodocyclaceae bacterium]|nr:hypothetical protein [Rhodocyclaceae bacterium]
MSAPEAIAFLQTMRAGGPPARILEFGWGGRIRTFACRNQNPGGSNTYNNPTSKTTIKTMGADSTLIAAVCG